MQVTDTEFCSRHMNREIHTAATAEILDIAISTVFRSTRDYDESKSVICLASEIV